MPYNPDTDPEVITARQRFVDAEKEARDKADRIMKDDQLARTKGNTPDQVDARKRVAALFCELHLAGESPEAVKALLDAIDYQMTVTTTNGRNVNLEKPKGTGFLGMGRKPQYVLSKTYHAHKPEDPIYCLEYFKVES